MLHDRRRRIDGRVCTEALEAVAIGNSAQLETVGPPETQFAVFVSRTGAVGSIEDQPEWKLLAADREIDLIEKEVAGYEVDRVAGLIVG